METKTTSELMNEFQKTLASEDKAFREALEARSVEEKDAAINTLIDHREKQQAFLYKNIIPCPKLGLKAEKEEDNFRIDPDTKKPRKLGYLELRMEQYMIRHKTDPSETSRKEVLNCISKLEVKQRVNFLYDLQKLRIANNLRIGSVERLYGITDKHLEYSGDILGKLEKHNIQMVDRVLKSSPDRDFYLWLVDNHLGVGPQLAGCIISGMADPERFRTVSALWAYCGLHVKSGKAAKRAQGETANWNNFLKTKLLGVLPSCMLKAQTRHIGTQRELTDAKNVKTLNDYKHRLQQKNELVKERYYYSDGGERFHHYSKESVKVYTSDGVFLKEINPLEIQRRSPAHIQAMSQRYMVKMFLCDILNKWREFKGLEPLKPYDEVYLREGVPHGGFR